MGVQISHDTKVILAIISIIASIIGIFILAVFLGPVAIVCSALTLFTPAVEMKLETRFKIIASCGLYLGILEFVLGILVLAGVITL
jgi:hypothetical protein